MFANSIPVMLPPNILTHSLDLTSFSGRIYKHVVRINL